MFQLMSTLREHFFNSLGTLSTLAHFKLNYFGPQRVFRKFWPQSCKGPEFSWGHVLSISPQTKAKWDKSLYWFTVTGAINYQKLGGLRQQKCILSRIWRPEVWNQGVSRTIFSRGEFVLCLFQLLVVPGILVATSLWSLPHCHLFCLFLLFPKKVTVTVSRN